MLESLKPQFNRFLRPMVRPLAAIGVHPNHATLAGVLLFGIGAWFIYQGVWRLALWIVIAGSLLDGLDGLLARETGKKSVFGAILDSSCDRLTEILLILGVLGYLLGMPIISFGKNALSLETRVWGIVFCYLAVTMSLMVSYVKARCEGAGVECRGGLLQRPERLILLCCGLFSGPRLMVAVLAAISVLGAITVVQRFVIAFRGSAGGGQGPLR
jgi:CDP-diacylglycerol--glycerol-3-phosphate 3-phosphatidyltransferase